MQGVTGIQDVCGILLENESDILVHDCEIQYTGFFSSRTDAFVYGINGLNLYGDNNIYSNKIHDITYKGAGTYKGVCALQVIAALSSVTIVCNHFIAGILNERENSSNLVLATGITATGKNGAVNIYHNSFYFSYAQNENLAPSALIFIPAGTAINLKVNNNILKINLTLHMKRHILFIWAVIV